MSLDYDIRKIADDVKWTDKHLSPITQSIIFATIPVDIGEITIDNYREFYMRYRLFSQAVVLPSKPPWVPDFSLDDVYKHIGLKVNVFTMTRHSWLTKRLSTFMNESIRRDPGPSCT